VNDAPTPSRPDCTMYFDVSHGGDVAVERCEEAIAALLAQLRSENSVDKTAPKLVNEEISLTEFRVRGDDPDRPAA
jgi:hypothetical protein